MYQRQKPKAIMSNSWRRLPTDSRANIGFSLECGIHMNAVAVKPFLALKAKSEIPPPLEKVKKKTNRSLRSRGHSLFLLWNNIKTNFLLAPLAILPPSNLQTWSNFISIILWPPSHVWIVYHPQRLTLESIQFYELCKYVVLSLWR